MCGRYSITTPVEALRQAFEFDELPNLPPRYNVAPTQPVPVVRRRPDGTRDLVLLRWGLIPFWAKDAAIGARSINARAETVAEKPTFREAFARRRCLVLADGFYEWQTTGGAKQPWRITLADGGPFAFAGLWESWRDPQGQVVETCTIITTDANALLQPIHPRMPVVLPEDAYALWLDPAASRDALLALLKPFPAERMRAWRVHPRVGNVRNDDPGVLVPLESEREPLESEREPRLL